MRAAFLIRCSTKKQDYERQVNDLTRLAKKFGYTSSDNMYLVSISLVKMMQVREIGSLFNV